MNIDEDIRRTFEWRSQADQPVPGFEPESMFSFGDPHRRPLLTIAIPTFRRQALLSQAVASVLAQTDLNGVELLIVDNDPESAGAEALLSAAPSIRELNVSYHRNPVNVGMFGNWNACIALARGTWVTLLNDDDLLDADFVAVIKKEIGRDPSLDAVISSVRYMDFRFSDPDVGADTAPAERVRNMFRFKLARRRRLTPRLMFFGNVAGSSLGLVFRKKVALEIGGYRSAEYPSADYLFNARLARDYKFIQLREALARVRVDVNESAKVETLIGFIAWQAALQQAMLGKEVPASWQRLMPPLLASALRHFSSFWRVPLPRDDISAALGVPIPEGKFRWMRLIRLARGRI